MLYALCCSCLQVSLCQYASSALLSSRAAPPPAPQAPAAARETPQERLKRIMAAQLNKQLNKDHLATAHKRLQVGDVGAGPGRHSRCTAQRTPPSACRWAATPCDVEAVTGVACRRFVCAALVMCSPLPGAAAVPALQASSCLCMLWKRQQGVCVHTQPANPSAAADAGSVCPALHHHHHQHQHQHAAAWPGQQAC